ncbi:MAG: ComF family protein [Clostridia bacterium]|nr:ComF family protein [Clostridia bacterium]
MKAADFFKRLVKGLDNALFPKDITCDACGTELVADTRYRLCAKCTEKMPIISGHKCLVCGAPLKDESDYCMRCQKQESVFERSRSPLVYDTEAKKLIYDMKFLGKKYICETLGAMMADCFVENNMQADVIVFVPMTAKEEKKRGFNQAELLAREVGGRLNIPVLPALAKIKETSAQKELTRADREKNLEGAYKCVFDEVKKLNVLLVDDIFTTGATANECSKALLKGRVKSVNVLTAAVTVLKPQGEVAPDDPHKNRKAKKRRKLDKEKHDVKLEIIED